jgi:Kef-type K+ transport system membrane component KefB
MMVTLHSNEIVALFLVAAVILAVARAFGEVALKAGQPIIIGEIVAGIVLGPAVFGYFFPDLSLWLLPRQGDASTILEGLTILAVSLLLLVAGMEVEFSELWRQSSRIALTSIMGFVLPFVVGLSAAYFLLPGINHGRPLLFALFFGTAFTISALPVIARILLDLGLFRSRVGTVIMSSAMVDDLIGWVMLSVLLSLGATQIVSISNVAVAVGLTLGFAIVMLTLGRGLVDRLLPWVRSRLTWPGGVIGLVLVAALAGSAATEAIGIHAVFGAFLVGIAIGDSRHLDQSSRDIIKLFVLNFFAPLYFATIGLKVNFLEHFDLQLTILILILASTAKVVGSGLGAYWTGMSKREALAVGFGMNARGMMQIVFGTLAFQYGLIDENVLVAFVVLAIVTSLVSGPMLEYCIGKKRPAFKRKPTGTWGMANDKLLAPAVAARIEERKEVMP